MTEIGNRNEECQRYSLMIWKLRNDGEIDRAIDTCREASERFPDNNFFYKLQGDLHVQKGEYEKAFPCYLEQLKRLEGKTKECKSFVRFYRRLKDNADDQELSKYRGKVLDAIRRNEISDDISELLVGFLGGGLTENAELKGLMEATDDDKQLQQVKRSVNDMVSRHDRGSIQAVIEYRIRSSDQRSSKQTNQFLVSIAEKEEMYDEALLLIQKMSELSQNAIVIRSLLRICRKRQDYSFAENMLTMDKAFVLKSDFNILYELVYYYEYNHNTELLELTLKRMNNNAAHSVPIARTLYNFYLRFNMFDEARLTAEHIKDQEEKKRGASEVKRIEEQFESEQGVWNKLQELVSESEHNRQMIAMRDLIRGFSHELGQPITNIRYSVQLYQMKARANQASSENIDELLNLILYQTERIGTMLSRFRPIVSSRSTEETFRVHERIRTVFDDLGQRLQMKGIRYSLEGDTEVSLWGDPVQFDQIFYNLVLNSMQAITESGKGDCISVRINRLHTGEIQIVFSDNGPGIVRENARKIFEPFFTTKDPSADNGGEGLGLFIVWNILKMFNGRILLDHKYKGGVRFKITITKPKGETGDESCSDY